MDTELDPITRLALAPSRAYRELMYRPHGATAQWIADRFDIVARPGQQLTDRPRQGDVLLRVSLGHPKAGACTVIDQPDTDQRRMAPGQLLLRRREAIREMPPTIEHDFGDQTDAETRTPVTVDAAAAVPPFDTNERSRVAEPLLTQRESGSAVEWTTRVHPAISGVTVDEIRTALANYTDATAVQSAIQARNQQDPAQAIDDSSPTPDVVFVECVHQFQMKCYLEAREHDGRAGESTLDSLGLIARQGSGLRTANRGNATAQRRLDTCDTRVKSASAQEFSAANWFNLMTDPSVFGLRTKGGQGLHVALVRNLRQAERHLLTLPAFRGMTPAGLGKELGLSEKHGGARPTATTTSVHTFGLAIDIGYLRNPWVRSGASWRAMQRAASLISGVNLTYRSAPAYFSSLGSDPSRSTGEIWDELEQRNAELIAYFGFAADPQALRAALAAGHARGTPGLIKEGENVSAAVSRWRADIHQDRRELAAGDFNGRQPERGFLTHPRDLVIALRDHGCLAWGAVDLGPEDRGSGDMMHYDARVDGVGRVLTEGTRAFLPTAGHPCLNSTTSETARPRRRRPEPRTCGLPQLGAAELEEALDFEAEMLGEAWQRRGSAVRPRLSFFLNDSTSAARNHFQCQATRVARRIGALAVGRGDPCVTRRVGPTSYDTGADIVGAITSAHTCLRSRIGVVHVFGHSGSHGIFGAAVLGTEGLYTSIDPSARATGARLISDVPAAALANDVVVVLHGCNQGAGTDSFAEQLYRHLRGTLTAPVVLAHYNGGCAGRDNSWIRFDNRTPTGRRVRSVTRHYSGDGCCSSTPRRVRGASDEAAGWLARESPDWEARATDTARLGEWQEEWEVENEDEQVAAGGCTCLGH